LGMDNLLPVDGIIEIRAVGAVVTPQADGLAYVRQATVQIGMSLGGAVAGFTLHILQITPRQGGISVSSGMARKTEGIVFLSFIHQGLIGPGVGGSGPLPEWFQMAGLAVLPSHVTGIHGDNDITPGGLRGSPRSRLRLGGNEALEAVFILPQKFLDLSLVGILGSEGYGPVTGVEDILRQGKIHLSNVFSPRPGHENLGFVHVVGVEVVIRIVAAENEMDFRDGRGEFLPGVEIHMGHNDDNPAIFLLQFRYPFFRGLDRVLKTVSGLFLV